MRFLIDECLHTSLVQVAHAAGHAADHVNFQCAQILPENQHLTIARPGNRELARWRNRHIGFVFQAFNLVPVLAALENVMLPLKLTGLDAKEQLEHARTALDLVGLSDRFHHFPRQLSGGQEQRVAIARAIVTDPDFILADEPTGNLDAGPANDVLALLAALNNEHGKTILMVTHDPHAAHYARSTRYLEKGLLLPKGQGPQDWLAASIPAHPRAYPQHKSKLTSSIALSDIGNQPIEAKAGEMMRTVWDSL